MGLFGSSLKKTDIEFSWNKNKIVIEDGYLRSEGLINTSRIPMKHIDTVTYSFEGIKIGPELKIIGQGTVLGTLKVGADLINEIQDWILAKL
ncbi:hypothetical protein M3685_09085 [Heyndrickxia oleronia]|uniref:hypothetical protein n=1 Tax=Heyndrickxia oleronia TaxID=38875 RepID=UPI00203FCD22|nr:hypothetical protein [Heyndrickxia oleronia]MCM3454091.1 hypothetical protein [Heyndrickxia oleronia]